MSETFLLQLVSPEHIVLSDHVTMVVVPGAQGDMGILAHHMSLISTLRAGLIKIYQEDTLVQQFYVSSGFVHVGEKDCSVIAEECVALENLDLETLILRIDEKNKALDVARGEEERAALKRDLQFANLQLHLLNQSRPTKAM
ncbi:MAG: ATP synthase F1 subunit epsilon [Janthinobacterium lividum]